MTGVVPALWPIVEIPFSSPHDYSPFLTRIHIFLGMGCAAIIHRRSTVTHISDLPPSPLQDIRTWTLIQLLIGNQ